MKRFLTMLLAWSLIFTLAACKRETPAVSQTTGDVQTSHAVEAGTENASVVYMTTDISAAGLMAVYQALDWTPTGKIAVKLSTGEPPASNFLRPELVGELIRLASALFCGVIAGLCVRWFFKGRTFFHFDGLAAPVNRDTDPNPLWRFLKNLGRNILATGPYFLLGILLSALFQRYVPSRLMTDLFGGNEALGVLMAATIGVPLYACGGGTIPLLQQWLYDGMSMGSAAAFMLTGPSTKITNLGALKIVLGLKHFCLYLAYVMLFSLATGILVNLFV
ncbi:MAG TPA: permease [Candidatus Fimiplasma intestinipullorum]|uniref:Permease n=1 Tax=Candidatus Fimiplasma intestinipullorum TaxID=2840825 RepID=A0A9D1HMB9_9FIRM|nr:permease [Candidatus Fimiplasma intestinipullorum]